MLRETRQFHSKVAGATYENEDGSGRQEILQKCQEGEELILKPSPNEYDDNAVKALRENGEQLGWLKRDIAEEMFNWLTQKDDDHIYDYKCEIKNLTGGGDKNLGCNILITKIKKYDKQEDTDQTQTSSPGEEEFVIDEEETPKRR